MRVNTPVMLATALAMTLGATATAAAASHHSRAHHSRAYLAMKSGAARNARAEAPFAPTGERYLPSGAVDCSSGRASIACNNPDN
jgi:hypothetical protein